MIYIYDSIVEPNVKTFSRYGATFKLEKRSKMGSKTFYSFVYPGMQKLLVVPEFAIQYREVESIINKFPPKREFEDYMKRFTRQIDKYASYEEFPTDESENGTMQVITADYKDIRIQVDYINRQLTLSDEFEIVKNNIFGNGITVLMNVEA